MLFKSHAIIGQYTGVKNHGDAHRVASRDTSVVQRYRSMSTEQYFRKIYFEPHPRRRSDPKTSMSNNVTAAASSRSDERRISLREVQVRVLVKQICYVGVTSLAIMVDFLACSNVNKGLTFPREHLFHFSVGAFIFLPILTVLNDSTH